MNSDVLTSSLTFGVVIPFALALDLEHFDVLIDRDLGFVFPRWEARATGGAGTASDTPLQRSSTLYGGGAKLVLAFAPLRARAAA